MNFEKDDVVILEGGIEYLIVDTVHYNSNKYLYLARLDKDDFALVKLDNKDNSVVLSKLSDDEYDAVLNLFVVQNNKEN